MTRIRYADGTTAECVILRLVGRRMRAVVAGTVDAAEFRLLLEDWVSDRGEVVCFEFGPDCPLSQQMPALKSPGEQAGCAVGGNCMLRRIVPFDGPVN